MEKGPFERIRDALDPKPEQKESWIPALNDIIRLKPGQDIELLALRRAGIQLEPEKLYRIRDYKKTDDGHLLTVDEVNVQYIAGKQIIAVMNTFQDALKINLFEPVQDHRVREN